MTHACCDASAITACTGCKRCAGCIAGRVVSVLEAAVFEAAVFEAAEFEAAEFEAALHSEEERKVCNLRI